MEKSDVGMRRSAAGTDRSGQYTKILAVSSDRVLPADAAAAAYSSGRPITVKETCYGIVITGTKEDVGAVADIVQALDKNHIFVKDRGFPVGDPRRCRAVRNGGQRPGFYTLHEEISKLGAIGDALDAYERNMPLKDVKWPAKVPVAQLEDIIRSLDGEDTPAAE